MFWRPNKTLFQSVSPVRDDPDTLDMSCYYVLQRTTNSLYRKKNISAFLHRNTNSLYLWLWNNKLGEIINSHSHGVFCSFFVSVFQFWLVTSFPKYKLDVKNVQIFFNFNFNVWVWATRQFQHVLTYLYMEQQTMFTLSLR